MSVAAIILIVVEFSLGPGLASYLAVPIVLVFFSSLEYAWSQETLAGLFAASTRSCCSPASFCNVTKARMPATLADRPIAIISSLR